MRPYTQLELETMLDTTTICPLFATASMETQHPFSPSGSEVRFTNISGSDNSYSSPRSIESANVLDRQARQRACNHRKKTSTSCASVHRRDTLPNGQER